MPDAATILRDYLDNLYRIRRTGQAVSETSYYGAMETLFNAIGQALGQQRVFCVLNTRNRGAGIPDGGLFLDVDAEDVRLDRPGFGRQPERGVIEAKSTAANIETIANGDQVERYLRIYGQVLVTNFYQFMLVGGGVTLAESHLRRWYGDKILDPRQHATTKKIHPVDMNAVGGVRFALMWVRQ